METHRLWDKLLIDEMQKIKVEEIADKHIVSVSPDTKVTTALKLSENSNLSLLPVLEDGRLIGIVNDYNLKDASNDTIKKLMQKPLFVESGKSIDYAIKYIMDHNITRVPVVDSSIGMRCIGTVSATELLKAKKNEK